MRKKACIGFTRSVVALQMDGHIVAMKAQSIFSDLPSVGENVNTRAQQINLCQCKTWTKSAKNLSGKQIFGRFPKDLWTFSKICQKSVEL